jgi:hypothetical protein
MTDSGRERPIEHERGAIPTSTELRMRPKDRPLANDAVNVEGFDQFLRAWVSNLALAPEPRLEFRALATEATQSARGARAARSRLAGPRRNGP